MYNKSLRTKKSPDDKSDCDGEDCPNVLPTPACDEDVPTPPAELPPCSTSDWSDWTDCSTSCSDKNETGTVSRDRICDESSDCACPEELSETQTCPDAPPPCNKLGLENKD